MRVPNLGETDLLVPLHDGLFEQPMWQTFLSRIRRLAAAECAAIRIVGPRGGQSVRLVSGDAALAGLGALDLSKMRAGRAYSQADFEGDAGGSGGAGGAGTAWRALLLRDDSGFGMLFAIADSTAVGPDIANLMVALQPHMAVALKTFAGMEAERARSGMSAATLARMNFGWITLDAQARIVDCDPQAARLLDLSGELARGPYDRLVPRSPALDRQLTALVRDYAADPRARPRAINLSHDPWIDVLAAPVRLETLAGGGKAVAALYIRGDRSSSADRHEQLADLFDLTAAEARIAWSLAQGLSIAETAKEHGLTLETARYYSKKIYAKTGARGQVELVRNILTGVLALA
ncbi:helix-turn-helix transcriptional regulator [Paraurantiacibacter namhicola]|uniref:HTH luxR-type domain-containing protein n=1 Tax=Paraurantiacibacter namhicola TaxID=645517 RepID=A0A1C7D6V6_9SPHN|nr:transcriptional regulator [Paraurantiacibacter namhicola]ANU07204.1 hypothetical protein A6F65_00893 [Paraurantiacibacter namhicola]